MYQIAGDAVVGFAARDPVSRDGACVVLPKCSGFNVADDSIDCLDSDIEVGRSHIYDLNGTTQSERKGERRQSVPSCQVWMA